MCSFGTDQYDRALVVLVLRCNVLLIFKWIKSKFLIKIKMFQININDKIETKPNFVKFATRKIGTGTYL